MVDGGAVRGAGGSEMKDSDFELLIASVKEAGRIKRGESEPANEFKVLAKVGGREGTSSGVKEITWRRTR
jgi:hypothetical protein